jgi:hypothetical protein
MKFYTLLFAGTVLLAFLGVTEASDAFPSVDALPSCPQLPNPLVMQDGTNVTTKEQWLKRREELKELFAHYMYGHMPPAPGNVVGEIVKTEPVDGGTHQMVRLRFGPDRKLTINLSMVIPPGKGPFPVMLYLFRGNKLPPDGMLRDYDVILKRGYIVATFGNIDCCRDVPDGNTPTYQTSYPDYDWAVLAVWAWGMSRCVDYLQTLDCVAPDKIAVCGHSRRGKACLLAAAFDERIALAAPSGSGTGGTDVCRNGREDVESITKKFSQWFVPGFRDFAGHEDRLPIDQHELIALVAPRPCLSKDALADAWVNPKGVQESILAAEPVYRLLGAGNLGDKLGLHFRPGKHDLTREDWEVIMDFCDKNLLGKTVTTRFDVLLPPNWQPTSLPATQSTTQPTTRP